MSDPTCDPDRTSWVEVAPDSDFPVQNLPFGVFARGGERPRVGVAIGEHVLDLAALAEGGAFDGVVGAPSATFGAPSLNPFLALGREAWRGARRRISDVLTAGSRLENTDLAGRALLARGDVELLLPFRPGDYVDFYSSLEHASNVGRMFRPDADPLLPNWRHMPVAYHGRASTVVVSGTPITRPTGQTGAPVDGGRPSFGPSGRLDFELEVGFVTGPGNPKGTTIAAGDADEHIFGFVLVNDWSARDIQGWEYRPLGPFLGKSFATSVSPWVVTLDALAPHRVPPPPQDPAPLDYLRTSEDWAFDIDLEVAVRPAGAERATTVTRTNFRDMYWTPPQQLAHATVNGTMTRPGDLYASGTVSGAEPGSFGSLLELTWNGERPLTLDGGATRTFLEDGDTVVMRGRAAATGAAPIGFGDLSGTVSGAGGARRT